MAQTTKISISVMPRESRARRRQFPYGLTAAVSALVRKIEV
jgi:hypothetical protein